VVTGTRLRLLIGALTALFAVSAIARAELVGTKGFTPPPARHVAFAQNCPPNRSSGAKARPIVPPDADLDGKGRIDYFLGAWSFSDARGNGLVVRLWCINRRAKTRLVHGRRRLVRFNDFFSLEISTSADANAHQATKVRPRGTLCPFVDGENLDTGFAPHQCVGIQQPPFDAVPQRIDWTAVNPHAQGDDRPGFDALETILWPLPNHEIVKGKIEQTHKGAFKFKGAFKVGDQVKSPNQLTRADRQQLLSDFAAKRAADRTLAACQGP
jgi:hypothetical protein